MKTVELVAIGPCGRLEQQLVTGAMWPHERHVLVPDGDKKLRFRRVVRLVSHMSYGKTRREKH